MGRRLRPPERAVSQRDNDQHTDDQWHWHLHAISDTLDRWRAGDITTFAKRRAIADENIRYYGDAGDAAEPWMTRTGKRYDAPAVLAEAAGVDEEVMLVALNAYRSDGRQAYCDVLATAVRGFR
jgi:hypothetical protein